ncbi:MAG: hypothetical protein IJC87_01250 [Clostridia bacterium]|nr:hypothetical protein [Clostridia bacterium]
MKSENVELESVASQPAEAENFLGERAEKPFGKFKDAESLLKAYESLESEFTRRSQRLKAIEGELLARSEKDKTQLKVEENQSSKGIENGQYILFDKYAEEIREEIEKGENKTDTAQAYIKVLERKLGQAENKLSEQKPDQNQGFGEEFSERVIKEYLKKIVQAKPTAKLFGGVALVAPPKKPQTIAEASVIAKNYIKLKGE